MAIEPISNSTNFIPVQSGAGISLSNASYDALPAIERPSLNGTDSLQNPPMPSMHGDPDPCTLAVMGFSLVIIGTLLSCREADEGNCLVYFGAGLIAINIVGAVFSLAR